MRDRLVVGSLFSGIGGIELGLERTGGFRTAWHSEVDPYCAAILRRHWPDVPNLGDVRDIGPDAPRVDVLAGGFPCQPVSQAGKRLGTFDPRWLWPEFARLVGELRPRLVLVENVPGLASKGLRDVVADLSSAGYDAEWQLVSAASVGAPHLRERIVLVAYPHGAGLQEQRGPGAVPTKQSAPQRGGEALADAEGITERARLRTDESTALRWRRPGDGGSPGGHWAPEPGMGRVAHGVPRRVDRLRALGNGVVPQVAEYVGHLILEAVREGRL